MTCQNEFTQSAALLKQLSTQDIGALPDLFQVLLNNLRELVKPFAARNPLRS